MFDLSAAIGKVTSFEDRAQRENFTNFDKIFFTSNAFCEVTGKTRLNKSQKVDVERMVLVCKRWTADSICFPHIFRSIKLLTMMTSW